MNLQQALIIFKLNLELYFKGTKSPSEVNLKLKKFKEDVKQTYKHLALAVHPDIHPQLGSERFRKLTEAKKVLLELHITERVNEPTITVSNIFNNSFTRTEGAHSERHASWYTDYSDIIDSFKWYGTTYK